MLVGATAAMTSLAQPDRRLLSAKERIKRFSARVIATYSRRFSSVPLRAP